MVMQDEKWAFHESRMEVVRALHSFPGCWDFQRDGRLQPGWSKWSEQSQSVNFGCGSRLEALMSAVRTLKGRSTR